MNVPVFSSVMPSMPVAHLQSALDFYTGPLGFEQSFRNGDSFAIVQRDSVRIGLLAATVSGVPAGHGRCYCVLSAGIDQFYATCQREGVTIIHELRDETYGMREFMIADADQNHVNFGQSLTEEGSEAG